MPQNFIERSRDQAFLLPPDVREWLPSDHLVWLVLDSLGDGTERVLRRVSTRRPRSPPAGAQHGLRVGAAASSRSARPCGSRLSSEVITRHPPGETSCLTLVWAVLDLYLTHATNGIKATQLERQRLKRIRYEGNEQTTPDEVTAA
jgi:hypothetical protein